MAMSFVSANEIRDTFEEVWRTVENEFNRAARTEAGLERINMEPAICSLKNWSDWYIIAQLFDCSPYGARCSENRVQSGALRSILEGGLWSAYRMRLLMQWTLRRPPSLHINFTVIKSKCERMWWMSSWLMAFLRPGSDRGPKHSIDPSLDWAFFGWKSSRRS